MHYDDERPKLTRKKIIRYIILGVVTLSVVILAIMSVSIVETNKAGYMQVKQAAIWGDMTCRLEPGMYMQWWGDIHDYNEAETFSFTADSAIGTEEDESLPTRFNDGAKAEVSGSLRVILPRDCEQLVSLHRKFHSMDGVMKKLVLPAVRKALFTAGPHMSSAESYAARRGEFAWLIEDQLINGTIMTEKQQEEQEDELTGLKKMVWVVLKKGCDNEGEGSCIGGFLRDESAFHEFGITVTNFVVDEINYSPEVLGQIEKQREARMDIITQQAEAKQADARASKAVAEGKAKVAETRATEEVAKTEKIVRAEAIKDAAVLKAQQQKEVAALDAEAALLEKQANIARGEGEAKRKELVMEADGALQQKLDALVQIQKAYAQALSTAKPGALVPYMQMGGGGSGGGDTSAMDLVDLLTAKTARDISLDFGISANGQ